MTVQTAPAPTLTRRRRVGDKIAAALRGGLAGALIAGVAWLAAGLIAGTAVVFLVVATIAVGAWVVMKGDVKTWVWLGLAVAWAVVLLEREVVQENGGLWVAAAGWLGVIVGARRAGINRWALPLLAYPLLSVAIVSLAGEDLLEPWGSRGCGSPPCSGPSSGRGRCVRPPSASPDEAQQQEAAEDQPGVEQHGRRPAAGRVAQHAADRRRQHRAHLARSGSSSRRRRPTGPRSARGRRPARATSAAAR